MRAVVLIGSALLRWDLKMHLKKNGSDCLRISLILSVLLLYGCSLRTQNIPRFSFRIEQKAVLNETIQLSVDGPSFTLHQVGEKLFYRVHFQGKSVDIESNILEDPSTGGPAYLEIASSEGFRDIVIREDLSDAVPQVFFIHLRTSSSGDFKSTYWMLPVHRFDQTTPLGFSHAFVEGIDDTRIFLRYKTQPKGETVNLNAIQSSDSPFGK